MREVEQILLDLVAIPSVSSQSNQPVIDYALPYFQSPQWIVEKHSHAAGKINLVAKTKNSRGKKVELALVCHTDTVPFDPEWKEAVKPAIRRRRIYGRGSCDVKGFLACILASVAETRLAGLSKPLAVILTADEEIGCVGAKHLASKSALRSRYAIIGEPTGLHPVRAGKGYALAEIVVRGREAHSAFPSAGHSAIYDAARIVSRLERLAKKVATRKNRDFDPPFTTLNVGLIHGGTAKNIVPGECRITVEWRPIPGQDPKWVAGLVETQLGGLDASLDIMRMDPAFDPSETHELETLLESLTRRKCATVAFGTEAAPLRSIARERIVFGPGDMGVAHKSGEFVPIAALRECVAHLRTVIDRLCG